MPPILTVNFKFVPAPYRIAYNNVVAIGWLALLSAITHAKGNGAIAGLISYVHSLGAS